MQPVRKRRATDLQKATQNRFVGCGSSYFYNTAFTLCQERVGSEIAGTNN